MPEPTPTKGDLLAALASERRFWEALVAVVQDAELMERPGANNGPWTFKDVTAHLNGWRELTVARLEAATQGAGAPANPWPAGLDEETDEGLNAINAWFYERSQTRSPAAMLEETMAQFDALGVAVASMSADELLTPGRFAWFGDLPLGPALLGGSFGHLHTEHEPDLRTWLRRELGYEPALPPAPPLFGYGD